MHTGEWCTDSPGLPEAPGTSANLAGQAGIQKRVKEIYMVKQQNKFENIFMPDAKTKLGRKDEKYIYPPSSDSM